MALCFVAVLGLWTLGDASRSQPAHTDLGCEGRGQDCRQQTTKVSHDAAVRMQAYVQGCSVLPGDAVALKIDDPSTLCAQHCQETPHLLEESPAQVLPEFRQKCPKEASSLKVLLDAVEFLDGHWNKCVTASTTTTTSPDAAAAVVSNQSQGVEDEDGDVPVEELVPAASASEADRDAVKIFYSGRDSWGAFLFLWSSIPMTYTHRSFKLIGTAQGIHDALLLRPKLPVSCDPEAVGEPAWLVVRSARRDVEAKYEDAWEEGFASLAGLVDVAAEAPEKFNDEDGLFSLARTGRSASALEATVSHLAHEIAAPAERGWMYGMLDALWGLLQSQKTVMMLTLANPKVKHYSGTAFKFECSEGAFAGSSSKSFMTWVDGDVRTVVSTDHLAFMAATLA